MTSTLVVRGAAKSGAKHCILPRETPKTRAAKTKRLSRELTNLKPWSGWKAVERAASEEKEFEEPQSNTSQEMEETSVRPARQAEGSQIVLASYSDAADPILDVNDGQDTNSDLIRSVASSNSKAAPAGPRCPLCVCPVNCVFFPVIECEDCGRSYHLRCIGYGMLPQDHPFYDSNISNAHLCAGCGCPEGDDLEVYCGYPGILFHRRDHDPDFREYLQKGCLNRAKYDDLI